MFLLHLFLLAIAIVAFKQCRRLTDDVMQLSAILISSICLLASFILLPWYLETGVLIAFLLFLQHTQSKIPAE